MKIYSAALFDELTAKAAASPRQRAHLNVHEQPTDLVQRFFVVAMRGSYFRPHRHLTRSELAVLLRGRVALLLFDDSGRVTARHEIGEGSGEMAYETSQGQWHTLIVTSDTAIFFEVKEGPYDPATAAEFAAWAPTEGAAEVELFQQRLRDAQVGDSLA